MNVITTSSKIYFVCRPKDLSSLDLPELQRHSVIPIVDLGRAAEPVLTAELQATQGIEVLMNAEQFLHPEVCNILQSQRVPTVWLEYFEDQQQSSLTSIFDQLQKCTGLNLNIITGDIRVIKRVFEENKRNINLAIKGSEASGFVSPETTLSLINYIEDLTRLHKTSPDIHIWGGCFTAEASATMMYSGAQGVVLESAHLLTQSYPSLSKSCRDHLHSFRIDHTTQLKLSDQLHFNVYNKGNSTAVAKIEKELKSSSGSNIAREICDRLHQDSITIFDDRHDDSLIQISPEAAFAATFTKTYGEDTTEALVAFHKATTALLTDAPTARQRLIKSPLCGAMGTNYPFIQGGMACISDVTEFAKAVADAGGLPTIALGIQSRTQLEECFGSLLSTMAGQPFGVNIITLDENPHRGEQLDWIRQIRPPFVVISAGSPNFAAQLMHEGLSVIYVTSDPGLLEVAWRNGIDYVVLEGCEAGGHIGHFSTLTLSQAAHILKRQKPEFRKKWLIYAGGIFNPNTIHRAALLGAQGVQMGTAYLATQEIVKTGAMGEVYQNTVLEASFGNTRVTGTSMGLKVRSIDSPKLQAISQLEKTITESDTSESQARKQLEEISVGSLFIAARSHDPHSDELLSDKNCYEQGQFMGGSVSGNISEITTVNELHRNLIEGGFEKPALHYNDVTTISVQEPRERIAVTAMAVANALGNDPDDVWQACLRLESGITEVPKSHWDHSKYYTESDNHTGKTYCRVAAFLSLDISRKDLGISPHDFRTMTSSTKLTLWLASQAITDSRIVDSDIARHRIGVFVSQNSGESASTIEDLTLSVISRDLAEQIQNSLGLDQTSIQSIVSTINKDRISIDDTTLLGRLNCAAGGFICNKYGFTGPSFSVSAACATGLVALYNGIQLINNGTLDAAVVGGGEEILHPASFLEFSALGALAGKNKYGLEARQYSKPFDKDRSGMVLGEGGGLLVIERESVAKKRGAPILAYITGAGASNNHKGMVESVAETQQLAINQSFTEAGYGPKQVDLVECHATATPTGDIEEVKALKTIYPPNSGTVLSSLKSQIGHTLGASGINSIIHGISAINARVLPPTINYTNADPDINLESAGFRVLGNPESWPHSPDHPRRFQVNAFGFGGANYVVQLEESGWQPDENNTPAEIEDRNSSVTMQKMESIRFFKGVKAGNEFRIGTTLQNGSQVNEVLTPYLDTLDNLSKQQRNILTRAGVHLRKGTPPQTAMVFAGQGSHYHSMGKELYRTFPTIRKWMDRIAELADFDILDLMFNSREEDLRKTQWQQPALFLLEYAIYQQLNEFGIVPVAMAGHSMGELTALCAAGSFSYEDGFSIINKRAQCMAQASEQAVDPGGMIAVDVPREILDEMVELDDNLYFTNFNSPHQIVIGGSTGAIAMFEEELENRKYWNYVLPVSMAFHSPIMRIVRDELGNYLDNINIKPATIPVLSNTTCKPYPDDPDAMKEVIIAHLESPVHWQDNVESLANDFNCHLFLEIGPQDTLCKLVADIVPNVELISCCNREDEVGALKQSVAALFSHGVLSAVGTPETLHLVPQTAKQVSEPDDTTIAAIIQREITGFALHGVNRFLIPAIKKAVRDEIGHDIENEKLSAMLGINSTPLSVPSTTHTALPPHISQPEQTGSSGQSVVEQVIAIIMEATGYERSEIEPDMDIRQDLSIRSSRLPVIMDAAEQRFNIIIKLEDFIDVRTINDMASKIEEVMARSGGQQPVTDRFSSQHIHSEDITDIAQLPINRIGLQRKDLGPVTIPERQLDSEDHIAILSVEGTPGGRDLAQQLQDSTGCTVSEITIPTKEKRNNQAVDGENEYSGLVILSSSNLHKKTTPARMIQLVGELFSEIQHFLAMSSKRFCIHLNSCGNLDAQPNVVGEGILGIFLAATLEYQSVLFRNLTFNDTTLTDGFDVALSSPSPYVELTLSAQGLSTRELTPMPATPTPPTLSMGKDTTILITGGTGGVGYALSGILANQGCTLILVGRSSAESVASQIEGLSQLGGEVHYFQCDVIKKDDVENLAVQLQNVSHVDTLIHAAGFLADNFIGLQTEGDFKRVVEVKYGALSDIVKVLAHHPISHIITLSSMAAVTGNIGQSNYCCANRMMAAMQHQFHAEHPEKNIKTFWLPPIEGAGMAEDPEVKELIRSTIGAKTFVGVDEIAEVLHQEIICGPSHPVDLIVARHIPDLPAIAIDQKNKGLFWFTTDKFSMVDEIIHRDYRKKEITTRKLLDHKTDLWLKDHQPFTFLKHPITSAIMVLESFLESAALVAPYLRVNTIEEIAFKKMIQCPQGAIAPTLTHCRHDVDTSKIHCKLGKPQKSDNEDTTDIDTCFNGILVSKAHTRESLNDYDPTEVKHEEMPLVSPEKMTKHYEKVSGLQGRYKVLQTIVTQSTDSVVGTMISPDCHDFDGGGQALYLFPAYVLEGLMQLTGFHVFAEDENHGPIVPTTIDSVEWYSENSPGNRSIITMSRVNRKAETSTWNGSARDDEGNIILKLTGLTMTHME